MPDRVADLEAGLRLVEAVGREVLSTLDLDGVLRRTVRLVRERFGFYHVVVSLRSGDRLVYHASFGADVDEEAHLAMLAEGASQSLDEGIMGCAARRRETVCVDDVTLDARYLRVAYAGRTRSEVAVPLELGGEVIGVLDAQQDRVAGFDARAIRLLEAVASILAIAVRNARLFEDAERRARQLRLVGEVGRIATSSPRLDDVLPRVVAAVREAFGYGAVVIDLLDDRGERVILTARAPDGEGLQVGHAQAVGEGVVGRVVETGRAVLVPDLGLCDFHVPLGAEFRSELCVPLRRGERVIGALDFESEQVGAFDRADLELAETLAEQLVGAIANARAYEQVRSLDRWRADLLAILVHDLRSPVTAVSASLEMLGTPLVGELNDKQRAQLNYAVASIGTLSEMIDGVLETYRLESGSRAVQKARARPEWLVERALRSVRVLAEVHEQRIVAAVAAGLPDLEVDVDLATRILTNLLTNAVKFSPGGSEVRVEAGPSPDPCFLELRVIDRGEGVPASEQARIFDKFAQVESRLGGRKYGTGLGLAFCREAVFVHGGTIRVESEPGQGSTFVFTLPVCAPG